MKKSLVILITGLFLLSSCAARVPVTNIPSSPPHEETVPDTDIVPVPSFQVSGTGAAVGQVIFADNSVGYGSVIFIFKTNSFVSLASTYADKNGYYMFDNLVPGSYEIYAGNDPESYDPVSSSFIGNPKATIDIRENMVTNIPTFTLLRNIHISLEDPHNNWQTVSISGARTAFESLINGNRPIFSWDTIPKATYYVVSVWSTDFSTGNRKEYNKSQVVSASSIIWADNLSLLIHKEYIVEVVAHMENDQSVARGYWKFFIDSPPSGWQLVD